MKTSTSCVLGLLVLSTLVPAAAAQPLTPGPEILVHGKVARGLGLAIGASGGFLIPWEDALSVSGRAYSPTEHPAEIRVLSTNRRRSLAPVATGLASGLYVVVWVQLENSTSGPLAAQLLDFAGRPVGEILEFAPEGSLHPPAVAAQPAGGFIVAWKDGNSIVARRFDGAGVPVGELVAVTRFGEIPDIASLPDGGFVVTWMARGAQGLLIYARVFGPDGAPVSAELSVAPTATTFLNTPKVAADAAGRFVLAWTEERLFGDRSLFQRFSAGGEALGPALVVDDTPTWSHSLLDVAARPNGSLLVLFDRREPPPDFPVVDGNGYLMVRAFDASGAALGGALQVTEPIIPFLAGAVAAASAEGWTVSWSMVGQTPTFQLVEGVYVRSFSPGCGGTASALCLGSGRFRVEVAWKTGAGAEGAGSPIPLTDDTGAFWFFSPSNYELNVKILDGRGSNGHFWVFYGSLTDVEFDLTVTDTATGQQRTYHNPAGTMASRADTSAF